MEFISYLDFNEFFIYHKWHNTGGLNCFLRKDLVDVSANDSEVMFMLCLEKTVQGRR